MQNDPRFRNQTFARDSLRTYLSDYAQTVKSALDSVPSASLDAASQLLLETRQRGGQIFAAGNGGSAAIAEHLSCDWQKGVHLPTQKALQVRSLTSNTALLTAIANDFGFSEIFAYQMELGALTAGDVAVLISSSGNSENILAAARFAKARGARVLALTGFSGGQLKELADVSLHIQFENYGVVEDCHQALMHALAQFHDLQFRERT